MEEHANYKILFYKNTAIQANPRKSEADRRLAKHTADRLQAKMYRLEVKYKNYFEMVPRY